MECAKIDVVAACDRKTSVVESIFNAQVGKWVLYIQKSDFFN